MIKMQGQIKKILPVESPSDKFKFQNFVLYVDGMYPNEIIFQLINSKVEILEKFKELEEVEVTFMISGRSYLTKDNETRWNNNLVVANITKS